MSGRQQGGSFEFSVVYGTNQQEPLCSMLKYETTVSSGKDSSKGSVVRYFYILLDCGWDYDTMDVSMIDDLMESVFLKVNVILISYPDMKHIGALPLIINRIRARKRERELEIESYASRGEKIPKGLREIPLPGICSTIPVQKLGHILFYDYFLSKQMMNYDLFQTNTAIFQSRRANSKGKQANVSRIERGLEKNIKNLEGGGNDDKEKNNKREGKEKTGEKGDTDLQASNKRKSFLPFSLEDISLVFGVDSPLQYTAIRFSQALTIYYTLKKKKQPLLQIIPYCAGRTLGGSLWKIIYKETDTVLYTVDFNYSKDQHLRGAYEAFGTFLKKKEKAPTLVITDAYKEPLLSYNIRIQTTLRYIEYYRLYLIQMSKNIRRVKLQQDKKLLLDIDDQGQDEQKREGIHGNLNEDDESENQQDKENYESYNPVTPLKDIKAHGLAEAVKETLKNGGNVLIPVDACSRVLSILLFLHNHKELTNNWLGQDNKFGSFRLAFLSPMADDYLAICSGMLEYMDPSLTTSFHETFNHPLVMPKVHIYKELQDFFEDSRPPERSLLYKNSSGDIIGGGTTDKNQKSNFSVNNRNMNTKKIVPTVLIATDGDLNVGYSRAVALDWMASARNRLLLIDVPKFGSFAFEIYVLKHFGQVAYDNYCKYYVESKSESLKILDQEIASSERTQDIMKQNNKNDDGTNDDDDEWVYINEDKMSSEDDSINRSKIIGRNNQISRNSTSLEARNRTSMIQSSSGKNIGMNPNSLWINVSLPTIEKLSGTDLMQYRAEQHRIEEERELRRQAERVLGTTEDKIPGDEILLESKSNKENEISGKKRQLDEDEKDLKDTAENDESKVDLKGNKKLKIVSETAFGEGKQVFLGKRHRRFNFNSSNFRMNTSFFLLPRCIMYEYMDPQFKEDEYGIYLLQQELKDYAAATNIQRQLQQTRQNTTMKGTSGSVSEDKEIDGKGVFMGLGLRGGKVYTDKYSNYWGIFEGMIRTTEEVKWEPVPMDENELLEMGGSSSSNSGIRFKRDATLQQSNMSLIDVPVQVSSIDKYKMELKMDVKVIKGFDGYTEGKNVRIALKQVEPENVVVIKQHKTIPSVEVFECEDETFFSSNEEGDKMAEDIEDTKSDVDKTLIERGYSNPASSLGGRFIDKCHHLKTQITRALTGRCDESLELINECQKWATGVFNPGTLNPVIFKIDANIMELVLDEHFAFKIPLQRVGNYEVAVIDGMMEVTPIEQMALAATKINKTLRMKTDADYNYLESELHLNDEGNVKENSSIGPPDHGEKSSDDMDEIKVKDEELNFQEQPLKHEESNALYKYVQNTVPNATIICEGEINLMTLMKILRSSGINSQLQLGKLPSLLCDKGTIIKKSPEVNSASSTARLLSNMLWEQQEEEQLTLEYLDDEGAMAVVRESTSFSSPTKLSEQNNTGGFLLEGPLGQEYFAVRKILYQIFKRF